MIRYDVLSFEKARCPFSISTGPHQILTENGKHMQPSEYTSSKFEEGKSLCDKI